MCPKAKRPHHYRVTALDLKERTIHEDQAFAHDGTGRNSLTVFIYRDRD
jgi:hypothetical protein